MGSRCVLIFISFLFCIGSAKGQVNTLEVDDIKEKKFSPYMLWRYGGKEGLADLKKNDRYLYLKELWYYSESFYVKRNYFENGLTLDESTIDVSRFEDQRQEEKETIITITDYKDVIVLLPSNKLLFKPVYK